LQKNATCHITETRRFLKNTDNEVRLVMVILRWKNTEAVID